MINDVKTTMSRLVIAANEPISLLKKLCACQQCLACRINDFIGPLKETPCGNKYIITCTDYHSKWAEALPLNTKEAECS